MEKGSDTWRQRSEKWTTWALMLLLLFSLYWRWRVASVRFFDADEFTHLHWAAQVYRGERPYIDFFTFFTPGFYWFLAPLYGFFGFGAELFQAARLAGLLLFVGILGCLVALFGWLRGWRWSLLPALLLAVLPMPYDKYLEVRPDNLATLLGMAGVCFQVVALTKGGKQPGWWILSGIFYAVAVVVLVKMLPFLAVGLVVAGLYFFSSFKPGRAFRLLMYFGVGLVAPLGLTGLWLLSLGSWGQVWYSLTRMALEANKVGLVMIMEPHLFFFPNNSFYGGTGYTLGFIFNHLVWVVGALVGTVRLLTPYIGGQGKKELVWSEILLGGIFFLSVVSYVAYFPLKHSQYLIPIAVFICFYAADAAAFWLEQSWYRLGGWGLVGGLVIGGLAIVQVTVSVNSPKLGWTHEIQMRDLGRLQQLVTSETPVIDLEGRILWSRSVYPVCCLSLGDFVGFLSRPPEPLAASLRRRPAKYIWQGETGRLYGLPQADLEYIKDNYRPVTGWAEKLWEIK